MIDDADRLLLARALELAERGSRTAAPNPLVGCVIARHGTVVAEGWHVRPGAPHAEAMALEVAQEGARDATVYVTLEPCAHHGRIVVLSNDPAPHASGKGLLQLVDAGIPVDVVDDDDPLAIAARRQNAGFRSAMTLGRPHVTYKAAQTLDGRTATRTGDSRWISGTEARARVHELRARAGAVLVGSGTALTDDPELTARDCDPPVEQQPLRVVWDRSARL
ncbi:MAG: bifunctional diaminohydroxyphosphoribosylaminopyrimidine deaminase/5-amino-6-(5-phosphoribosylamino)uracil reductase RibD, partial [Thermoleophilia bacterium]|nr:bifunctional diaminohydroxyphosphoribosylaminopyrimidine deaminase/5-amino-6-(5-phosphoribosylamino)uracil reductase RibD [Thermoleophilia bacterium]